MLAEPIAVTLLIVDAFEQLGIPYMIGGSLASALHGVARSTLDSDVIAAITLEQVEPLVKALEIHFYVDGEMIRDAVVNQSSFNVIHATTMFKVDVFILKQRDFEQNQISRRVMQPVSTDPDRNVYVTTAEDIILAKLDWYRQGGEISDRQWRDVIGVIKVQAGRLDKAYLETWAANLGVNDLLGKVFGEAEAS